jgi:peroxiredoxin
MIELGELERNSGEFEKRRIKLFVVSNDDQSAARESQAQFPHLVVVSDAEQSFAKAVQVLQAGGAPDGRDTNTPTIFLLDGSGAVRWIHRDRRFIERIASPELLAAADRLLASSSR